LKLQENKKILVKIYTNCEADKRQLNSWIHIKSRHTKVLVDALKGIDINANVNWPLAYMGTVHGYKTKENAIIEVKRKNRKDYSPLSFQKVVFFKITYKPRVK